MGNAKVSKAIATFSLPAGHTCPFAKECLSKADRFTGKIIDGKHCRFRCFAASDECLYKAARIQRWNNYDLLQESDSIQSMGNLIQRSLPYGVNMVRIHISGDYYHEKYFLAWLNVALNNPMTVFYGYTKATPFVVKYRKFIPPNFRLTASKGGTCDDLIHQHKLKYAEVVFSTEEARRKGLELDHDDSHAFVGNESFALLLHGSQPAGSEASRAWQIIKKTEGGGYSENKKQLRMERPIKILVPFLKISPPSPSRGVAKKPVKKSVKKLFKTIPSMGWGSLMNKFK